MSGNSDCKVYVGNMHERVSDRVLYDTLIQADLRSQNTNLQRLQTMLSSYIAHHRTILPDGIYTIKDHRARHSLGFGCHIWLLRRFLGVELLDN